MIAAAERANLRIGEESVQQGGSHVQGLLMESKLTGDLHKPADGYCSHCVVDEVLIEAGAVLFKAAAIRPHLAFHFAQVPARKTHPVIPSFQNINSYQ